MGKSLVIKGADFSANAIPQEPMQGQLSIANGTLSMLSNSPAYGTRTISSSQPNRAVYTGDGIFIPYGATMVISGLKPDTAVGLRFDGCYYSSAEPSTENVLGDMHGGLTDLADTFLFNADGSEDSVQFVNNYAAAYFVFGFARGAYKNTEITASSYSIQYEIVLA